MVQWLRDCLPMQGTQVQSQVRELRSHLLQSNSAHVPQPLSLSAARGSPCSTAREASPLQQRPNTTKNKLAKTPKAKQNRKMHTAGAHPQQCPAGGDRSSHGAPRTGPGGRGQPGPRALDLDQAGFCLFTIPSPPFSSSSPASSPLSRHSGLDNSCHATPLPAPPRAV